MPIKNKPGFVPKTFKYQPDYYIELFGRICAVFTHQASHVTLYIEIDADVWNHKHFMDASGDPIVEYQGEHNRMRLRRHATLRAALEHMEKILSNPEWGKTLEEKPVFSKHSIWYPNENLWTKPKTFHRKGNGKRFTLNYNDRRILEALGYPENDFDQIERAANKSTYTYQDENGEPQYAVNVHEAVELLGRETFLSGIARSAFHCTTSRVNPDTGQRVGFDSSVLFR